MSNNTVSGTLLTVI